VFFPWVTALVVFVLGIDQRPIAITGSALFVSGAWLLNVRTCGAEAGSFNIASVVESSAADRALRNAGWRANVAFDVDFENGERVPGRLRHAGPSNSRTARAGPPSRCRV